MSNKVMYTINRRKDYGYYLLSMEVYTHDNGCGDKRAFSVSWQASDPFDGWYGFKVEVESSDVDKLVENARLAKRLVVGYSPDDIIAGMKADRVMYDSRTAKYVTESAMLDKGILAWRDDWRAMGKAHCTAGAEARDEKSAKAEIAKALFEQGHFGYLAEWVNAGKPVMCLNDHAPEFAPIEHILNPKG